MECEYQRAECLDKLSNFQLNHLKDSPFETVAQGMIRRADNEAYQAYNFVESIKNEIYEPLMREYAKHYDEQGDILATVKEQIKAYRKVEEKMEKEQNDYVDSSLDYEKAMKLFEIKRREEGTKFYKSRHFTATNLKLRET